MWSELISAALALVCAITGIVLVAKNGKVKDEQCKKAIAGYVLMLTGIILVISFILEAIFHALQQHGKHGASSQVLYGY